MFAPASRALLEQWTTTPPAHAVDLGCGPGHSTRLVHRVTGAARTTGVERSPAHLTRARSMPVRGVGYIEADVTAVPLPAGSADLVFARFLLTHLADPAAALRHWAAVLRPGARLLVQETAEIASEDRALARYYDLVGALQRHHGQDLTIGHRLESLATIAGLTVRAAGERRLDAPVATMARLHALNLRTWRNDPFARDSFDSTELDDLHERLTTLARAARPAAALRYVMGELVVEV